ncbi:MAG: DNA-processing protein DprA [Patescibacteria group bacterium]
MTDGEIVFLNAFSTIPGVGAVTMRALKDHFGSYEAAWRADTVQYAAVHLDTSARVALMAGKRMVHPAGALRRVAETGAWMMAEDDPLYPPLLKHIHSPPAILYGKGQKSALTPEICGIAVVGTRRPTPYGISAAEHIVQGLTYAGITVISGLATGIDTKAHKTVLEHGGTTVAVLGSGIDSASLFPPENRMLAERIAQSPGAVISEYAPGTPAVKEHFPMRNRIIAGLARGTLVVEAREKSGALITARSALEENRDVFAVPGSIFSAVSAGPNRLIREGARVAMGHGDILEELGIVAPSAVHETHHESLTEKERMILGLMEHPLGIDDIREQTRLPVPEIMATLSLLELKQMVRGVGGDIFQKV